METGNRWCGSHYLKLRDIAPENGWLEDEHSFWDGPFSGAMLVSGGALNFDMHLYKQQQLNIYIYVYHDHREPSPCFLVHVALVLSRFLEVASNQTPKIELYNSTSKKTRWNPQQHSTGKKTFHWFVDRHWQLPLMEEILHQLKSSLSLYLQSLIHPRWYRISSINSSTRRIQSTFRQCNSTLPMRN